MNTNNRKILKTISSGLTGQVDRDIEYLRSQYEKYHRQDGYGEIKDACERLIEMLKGGNESEMLQEAEDPTPRFEVPVEWMIQEDKESDRSVWDAADPADPADHNEETMTSEAFQVITSIIKEIEQKEQELLKEEDVIWFDSFDEFESAIYIDQFQPEKDLMQPDISFASIYLDYAMRLNDLGHYEEAIEALEKALKWNPVNEMIRLEYARSFRLKGDLDKLEQTALETFRVLFHRDAMSKCYDDLAYCFQKKRRFLEAICCYESSLLCDPTDQEARDQIAFLELTQPQIGVPKLETIIEILVDHKIPPGPSVDVVQLACQLAGFCKEIGEQEEALHYISIAFELLPSYEIQMQMEEIIKMQDGMVEKEMVIH